MPVTFRPASDLTTNEAGERHDARLLQARCLRSERQSATTYVDTEKAGTYELDIVLQSYGSVSGTVFDHSTGLSIAGATVDFYLQDENGSWPPTTPGWGEPTRTVYTNAPGTYTSEELPLVNYKVRFFTVHFGSQWWQYAPTVDLAQMETLDTPGQTLSDIDGWFNQPYGVCREQHKGRERYAPGLIIHGGAIVDALRTA